MMGLTMLLVLVEVAVPAGLVCRAVGAFMIFGVGRLKTIMGPPMRLERMVIVGFLGAGAGRAGPLGAGPARGVVAVGRTGLMLLPAGLLRAGVVAGGRVVGRVGEGRVGLGEVRRADLAGAAAVVEGRGAILGVDLGAGLGAGACFDGGAFRGGAGGLPFVLSARVGCVSRIAERARLVTEIFRAKGDFRTDIGRFLSRLPAFRGSTTI